MTKALHEEIIDEIGTQTLARFGLNIFDTTSYSQSVEATRMRLDVNDVLNSDRVKNKNPDNDTTSHGFLFEPLDVGMRNIENAKNKINERWIRHDEISKANDTLVDASLINKSDVLNALDGKEIDILGEIQHKSFESKESQSKRKPTTKVKSNSHKLKGTKGNKKYMEAGGLNIVVNFDRYNEDIEHYQNIIQKSKDEKAIAEAKIMLKKIKKGKVDYETSKRENAGIFALKTDVTYMAKNSAGVAISGATAAALQTLGSGLIFEIKDYYLNKNVDLIDRISRLFQNTLKSFKDGFINGAGFGILDMLVNIVSSCLKTLSTKIMYLWENVRTAAKSVYNAVLSYIQGKITSFQELIIAISKAIFSVLMVIMAETIDTKIFSYLSTFLPQELASMFSGIFTIIISAIAVVLGTKAIEKSLGYLFGVYAELTKSREKRAEISVLIDEVLPELMSDNEKIRQMIDEKISQMNIQLQGSFDSLQEAFMANNHTLFIDSLVEINVIFGKKLKYVNFNEFNDAMISDEPMRF
ncbi:hypothetical protein [Campylobacter mucosalis]|uniref:hypothetical protein n=1 Tax=Campylobacter mucosalis TaxID=202 RepID=UPI00146FDE95|nr:hypothetical protein [Campylobacter mucosalis]